MATLNNAAYFRGEVVTLYGTFKSPNGEPADPLNPTVKIEYANAANQIIVILPSTPMRKMTTGRWFYNWTIPTNAPLTTYNVITMGIIDGKTAQSTEDLVVGNPSLTTRRSFLKYGCGSFLQTSRTYEPRLSPQLPRGTF